MRKLAAIFLLLLLSFNFMGYRLWFYYVQHRADERLVAQLDAAEYEEADLLTLRVSLHMPYQLDQADFERVDGEIEVDGKIYRYVKRKVEHGALVLQCLPDAQKMQLEKARHSYLQLTHDLPSSSGKSDNAQSNLFKTLWAEYISQPLLWSFKTPDNRSTYRYAQNVVLLPFSFSHTPEQPPDGHFA